jgi:hypothetical protein
LKRRKSGGRAEVKQIDKLIESGVILYEIKNQKVFEGEYYTFDVLCIYFN